MAECIHCQRKDRTISFTIGVCAECICNEFDRVKGHIKNIHAGVREDYGLPAEPPRAKDGLLCDICVNQCQIPDRGRGCGCVGMVRCG